MALATAWRDYRDEERTVEGLDMGDAAQTTYRYLRIGMVLAVVALFASILLERMETDCFQNSISAYYYTPAKAIFVGVLMAVGMALIAIQGRTQAIDIGLNFAGMLAPIVAVAPTTNVGLCYSIQPEPLPLDADGELAQWVIADIDNNVSALLVTAILGLLVAALIAAIAAGRLVIRYGLLATLGFVLLVTALYLWWDSFYTEIHGIAAVAMFACLIAVVALNAHWVRTTSGPGLYFRLYAVIAVLMFVVPLVLLPFDWDHKVLVLETVELALFAVFWVVQTAEFWFGAPLVPTEARVARAATDPEQLEPIRRQIPVAPADADLPFEED